MHRALFFTATLVFTSVLVPAGNRIEISTPMSPPAWALLELEVLQASSMAAEELYATYNDERGYLLHTPRWGTLDGADDAIEIYANWTLLHMLGGSDSALKLFKQALEGHLRQYKELKTVKTEIAKDGAYYKEFMPMSDWHHNGIVFRKRMKRFAGFYLNEDPDALNYDPEHKIIRSIWNGSRGPMIRRATQYDWVGDPFKGRFHILHSAGGVSEMLDAEETYPEMLAHCAEYLHSAGDHPLNLIATQLTLNAFALGHEEKYRRWSIEYVDAWKDRTEKNGAIFPVTSAWMGASGAKPRAIGSVEPMDGISLPGHPSTR